MNAGALPLKALDRGPKKHGFIIGMRSNDQGCASCHATYAGKEATLGNVQLYNDLLCTDAKHLLSTF